MKKKIGTTCLSCGHRQVMEITENASLQFYRCEGCKKLVYLDEKSHFHFINNKGESVKAYYANSNGARKIVRYEKVTENKRAYPLCVTC